MFDLNNVKTPAYIVDTDLLEGNLNLLKSVMEATDCRILLAQKAFSMFSVYPLISRYLSGTTASSLHEAMLGHEYFGGETHIYAPAYREDDFESILEICDHIVFNSPSQWNRFKARVRASSKKHECGIRINPEYSEQNHEIYDPCSANSRLGVTFDNFDPDIISEIDGLHFHTMCEQNSDVLIRTFNAFEDKFGVYLKNLKWLNLGGGHHITRPGYDIVSLIGLINRVKEKYSLQVYLEPGEAIALNCGYLVTSVLDTLKNGMDIAIIDASAACHMPDVIEMPYRPHILESGKPGEKPFTYRLGAATCLAGDIIGDYSFDTPLYPGDKLVFTDMAIYSMVKNNTFNGIKLPSILTYSKAEGLNLIREFGYRDFLNRLS